MEIVGWVVLALTVVSVVIAIIPLKKQELAGNWKWTAMLAGIDLVVTVLIVVLGWWLAAVIWAALTAYIGWIAYQYYQIDNHQPV